MNEFTDKNEKAFLDGCGAIGAEPNAMFNTQKERYLVSECLKNTKMRSDGVILQHRTKLIAHLFVDRSDNLLIGNHIKSLSPTTGNRNLLRPGVNVWTDSGQAALFATPISLQVLYPSLQPVCHWALFR